MRGCGIPRGSWLKPGGSVDRVEGIIIETFVILCQYNSQIHRVPAGRIVTNKPSLLCRAAAHFVSSFGTLV
jgi:hypothetical protein